MADLVSLFTKIKPAVVAFAPHPLGPPDQLPPAPLNVVGSGFCVDPRGIVVTARHVLEPIMNMSPLVVFSLFDTGSRKFSLVRCLFFTYSFVPDLDLAVGRLWRPSIAFPWVPLKIDEGVTEGTRVVSCRFPLGMVFGAGGPPQRGMGSLSSIFQTGIVASVVPTPWSPVEHRESYLLDMNLNSGNSGGPIFTEDGTVVGVAVSVTRPFSPVVDETGQETRYQALIPAGLTTALPVSAALLEVIEKVKALTPEELDEQRADAGKHSP